MQASFCNSCQHAIGGRTQHTLMSTPQSGHLLGSSKKLLPRTPNTTFARSRTLTRSCSVSLRLLRIVSLVGLSIVQQRVQVAEQTTKMVKSSIGQVAIVMQQVRGVAKLVISEAASIQSQMQGKMHMLVEASISRSIGEVSQALKQELGTLVSGFIVTSTRDTQAAIEGLRQELQTKFHQDQAELQQKQVETQGKRNKIAYSIQTLTLQLNSFKLVSQEEVGKVMGRFLLNLM